MTSIKNFLSDITAASQNSRNGLEANGRLKRSPDYTKPRISSTRPRSDKGVTFHFAHKTISKRNDISNSQRDATSAPSHQAYIERLEAVEISNEDQHSIAVDARISAGFQVPDNPSFRYPDLSIEPGRESFGTLGKSKAERVEFWRDVEAAEGRTARVQSRIIAELPYETTQRERLKISMIFCKNIASEGLPYWATIHAPTKSNDRRNYHLHIAYHDRPSAQNKEGQWDFSIISTRVKTNRVRVEHRPYKQNKTLSVRDRNWVRSLREKFADANNEVLAEGHHEKRLDARSYKESGISKTPTEHLGFKSNAAEKFGLETTRGQRNTKKEYDWRIAQSTARWDNLINEHDATILFQDYSEDEDGWKSVKDIKTSLLGGRQLALRSAKIDLLTEAVSTRVETRKKFLKSERERLNSNQKLRVTAESQQTISLIDIESTILKNRQPELVRIYTHMQKESANAKQHEDQMWLSVVGKVSLHERSHDREIFANAPSYPIAETFENPTDVAVYETAPVGELIEDIFGNEDDTSRPETTQEGENKSDTSDPIINEIDPILEPEEINPNGPIQPTIPGTLLIPEIEHRAELRILNNRLMAMTNREVRVRAITSRDASEFLDHGDEKHQAKRGWIVLRSEAQKRGIDLETGHQDINSATDKDRAALHTDQSNESVLEIREELVRVMSR